jgi:signal transduction histidine kinase
MPPTLGAAPGPGRRLGGGTRVHPGFDASSHPGQYGRAVRFPAVRGLSRGDVVVPAVLAVVAAAELAALRIGPLVVTQIPSTVACLLLVWRRRLPRLVAPAAVLLIATQELVGIPRDEPSAPIAIIGLAGYSLGRQVEDLRGLLGVALMDAIIWVPGGVPAPSDIPFVLVLTVGPWLFGRIVREHARSSEASAAEARRLAEEQERAARAAVQAERARIARELHDVIAHSLSVMVVQAGAAEDLLRRDPARAAQAMTEVQRAGRRALSETGRLLDLIRDDDESGLAPQPGTADLPRLAEEFRRSGLPVGLDLDGGTGGLSPGVDLSIYRIVEEGLTNALKHAAGARTRVRLRRSADEITVDITDEGGTPAETWRTGGYGLIGLRERVSVFGGTLDAGPTGSGGFRLCARLPAAEDG